MTLLDHFFLLLHCLFVYLSDSVTQEKIKKDISVFQQGYHLNLSESNKFSYTNLRIVLRKCPEYRNVFYTRIGKLSHKYHLSKILQCLLKPYPLLFIGTSAENIGGGLYIEHGNSTIIHASFIGEFCWINQNVTIGANDRGTPSLGNHVKVHTGAVVLGPIHIGNNTIIGANATIVKDIPANCTVVPSPSYVIKKEGKKVYDKI